MAAGYIIEKYAGNFTQYVIERILQPLGMTSSGYSQSLADDSGRRSQGWDAGTGRRIPHIDPDAAEMLAAAGGVISTARDMVRSLSGVVLEASVLMIGVSD